ncbi:DNA adenine methylase [Acidiplasma sp.]|uniref:DNA adenine methylase n=1 Tax=Acidiplasma sp. TaxID=1872114 RepID=UPI00258292E2|nr:DNA adenine methylase [Acidiplasma sp.]
MKSLFSYACGKMHLINYIKKIYIKSHKNAFIDVFGCSGKFLMNIDSKIKIYNDIDNSLVNIFETLRNNTELLKNRFNYTLNSRKLFNDYKNDSKNKSHLIIYQRKQDGTNTMECVIVSIERT